MLAVIFQVEPKNGRAEAYFDAAAKLRDEVEKIDGFISVERFESVSTPGKFVSLSFWRDEAAVKTWQSHSEHRIAQEKGKAEIFADFRISVAEIMRDYTMADRI
jgi:heme-degrading monooxygenase HmoA